MTIPNPPDFFNLDSWVVFCNKRHLSENVWEYRLEVWCARRKHSFVGYSPNEVLGKVKVWHDSVIALVRHALEHPRE